MGMSSGISSLYAGIFTMASSIIGSLIFSTPYTYPAQILFLYFAFRISKSYLKTMIDLVRLSTKIIYLSGLVENSHDKPLSRDSLRSYLL